MNKRERLSAAFQNKVPDRIPAGFWIHYETRDVEALARDHLNFYHSTDVDIMKIMYEYMYSIEEQIHTPNDWYHIKPLGKKSPEFTKQVELIQRIHDQVDDDVMFFSTMFNAVKMATWVTSDQLVMEHLRSNPDAVLAGINAFCDTTIEWLDILFQAGLDGIYFSAQFGEIGRFNDAEWRMIVEPSDLRILNFIHKNKKLIILHICGEPEYEFKVHIDRYENYPKDMVNWAIFPNDFNLFKGRDLFKCPVLGGMDNWKEILNGTKDDIQAAVNAAIQDGGNRGFVLGADCSIQGNFDLGRIRQAVDISRTYNIH